MANDKENAWIARVLGVSPGSRRPSAAEPARLPIRQETRRPEPKRYASIDCAQVWEEAHDTVEAQVGMLADVLHDGAETILHQIATASVKEVSARLRGELESALREVDAVPPEARTDAVAKARRVIGEHRQRIAGDRLFGLLDANTYGVPVTIRGTLAGALDRIDRDLGT